VKIAKFLVSLAFTAMAVIIRDIHKGSTGGTSGSGYRDSTGRGEKLGGGEGRGGGQGNKLNGSGFST
jgi:hypothetical protein